MTGKEIFTRAPSYGVATPLPSLPAGWHASLYRVLTNGDLVAVVTDQDFATEWARITSANGSAVPPSRILAMARTGTARLLILRDGRWIDELRFPLEFAYLAVDRFADGRWLIVGTRSNRKPNARIVTPDGKLLARFLLGDGIEHVAIDGAGHIWVGWFDEGVFGNSGWHVPGEQWAPSSRGIGCFDATGALLPLADLPAAAGMIADCYALTAVGDGAWACPYTDFPLAHFRSGRPVRWWASDLAGPRALAVDGPHVLLAGGYGEEANRLALLSLDGDGQGQSVRLLAQWTLPLRRLPASANWSPVWDAPSLLSACGDTIHVIDDGVWHRWRVAELLAGLAT